MEDLPILVLPVLAVAFVLGTCVVVWPKVADRLGVRRRMREHRRRFEASDVGP